MNTPRAAAGTRPDRRMYKLTELSEIDRGHTQTCTVDRYIDTDTDTDADADADTDTDTSRHKQTAEPTMSLYSSPVALANRWNPLVWTR